MDKKTDIGPNDNSSCVETAPPKRILPEDAFNEGGMPGDAPSRKNVTEESPEKRIQTKGSLPLRRSYLMTK